MLTILASLWNGSPEATMLDVKVPPLVSRPGSKVSVIG